LFTPFYLMFLREPRVSWDFVCDPIPTDPAETPEEYVELIKQRMRTAYELVFEQLQSVFDKAKRRYDPRVKFCRFSVGQRVWYFCPRRFKNRSPKWSLQTAGPYEIIRKVNDVNYVIRLSSKHPAFTVHVDRLRKYKTTEGQETGRPLDSAPIPVPSRPKPLVPKNVEISQEPRSQRDRRVPRRLIADL
jgi:hypothetical protein